MKIKITEIFSSIQGEGTDSGYPFTFIRFSNCNLRCNYCDTEYSFENGKEITVEEVVKKVTEFGIDKILLTGGEPLLQKEGLLELAKILHDQGYKIYIETNGSILLDKIPSYITKIIDVKTLSSGHEESFNIKNINYINKGDELKFVISNKDDFNFSINFILNYSLDFKYKVIFSPVLGTLEPSELGNWILESKLPIKLGLQLHKIINMR